MGTHVGSASPDDSDPEAGSVGRGCGGNGESGEMGTTGETGGTGTTGETGTGGITPPVYGNTTVFVIVGCAIMVVVGPASIHEQALSKRYEMSP